MNTGKFYRHITLRDLPGCYATADMDEECTSITVTLRNMSIGQDEQGEVIVGDLPDTVWLSASDMDILARAWLRYRMGHAGSEETNA